MSDYLCVDVEASGLHENCYPIEVALVDTSSDFERSWLVRPVEAWAQTGEWEAQAEAVHRISRDELMRDGVAPAAVVAEILECVGARRIVSDCPSADGRWLRQLALAVGDKLDVVIDDIEEVARRITWARGINHSTSLVEAQRYAQAQFPKVHRALPDARHNAAVIAYLLRCEPR